MKLELRTKYANSIKIFVTFILRHPKIVILSCMLFVFTISYNVVYDFTVKSINGLLLSKYGGYGPEFVLNCERSSYDHIRERCDLDLNDKELTKLTFKDENVLTFEFLEKSYNKISLLESEHPNAAVISPFLNWPICYPYNIDNITESARKDLENYILKIVNYDQSTQLDSLFFDDLTMVNHLIKQAHKFSIFVIHKKGSNIKNYFDGFEVVSNCSTSNKKSIDEFISYYLRTNSLPFSGSFLSKTTTFIEVCQLLSLFVIIYLMISHQHKSTSNNFLFITWIIEVFISAAAGINLVTFIDKNETWETLFQPSSFFTWVTYIFSIFIFSSKDILILIRTLEADQDSGLPRNKFHKKLYKLYAGYDGESFHSLPLLTRMLIVDLSYLSFLMYISKFFFSFFFEGELSEYLSLKLSMLIKAIIVALIFDNFLQSTCVVGSLVVDHRNYELTDLLNEDSHSSLSKFSDYNEKSVSSYLFEPNYTEFGQLNVNTFKHKLALIILRIINYKHSANRLSVFPIILFVHIVTAVLYWAMLMPRNLLTDESKLLSFESSKILSNHNDFVYYMELGSVLMFIITITLLVFKVTKTKSTKNDQINLNYSDSDFDIDANRRVFKNIELYCKEKGHYLDILKIKTNHNCSFVISMGLDRRVLVWSPLIRPEVPDPINISTSMTVGNIKREFWPINLLDISDDGRYIILINYEFGIVKCYEREKLSYIWEISIFELYPGLERKDIKVLESFFRCKTVPGFLTRKILKKKMQKKTSKRLQRRGSQSSAFSMNSKISGNFPPPPSAINMAPKLERDNELEDFDEQASRSHFIFILDSGLIVDVSCTNGKAQTLNALDVLYPQKNFGHLKIVSAKKVVTPRISDRIVLQSSNGDLVVATIINNRFKLRVLSLNHNYYMSYNGYSQLTGATLMNSYNQQVDFKAKFKEDTKIDGGINNSSQPSQTCFSTNRLILETLEFVGFIIRVIDSTAELIDIQTGTVIKTFTVGYFKPNSFKVSHSEPTHCKFCGCASISSLSVIYEDFDCNTLIVHTFRVDLKRSKSNICLRVERDSREIRCLGFNSVTEHQYWYENVEGFQLTDVNMILGLKKKTSFDAPKDEFISGTAKSTSKNELHDMIENSGLSSLRSRKHKISPVHIPKSQTADDIFEGFLINVFDGKLIPHELPSSSKLKSTPLVSTKIYCIEKYGYKSIITNFHNLLEIFYLGGDSLIDHDIYYNGTNAARSAILNGEKEDHQVAQSSSHKSQAVDSNLLFINKRRR